MAKGVCEEPQRGVTVIEEYKGTRQTVGGDLLPRGLIDKLNEVIERLNQVAVVVDDLLQKEEDEEKPGGLH